MSQEKHYSDEFLNAFVDNQLAPEEKARAYIEISQDEILNRQVCELRKLRDLVQLAYRDTPLAPSQPAVQQPRSTRLRASIAAAAVLALGVAIGIQLEVSEKARDTAATASPQTVAATASTSAPIVSVAAHRTPTVVRRPTARPVHMSQPAAATSTPSEPVTVPPALTTLEETTITHYTPDRLDTPAGDVANKVLVHIAHDNNAQLGQALEDVEGLMRYYRERRQSARVEVVINGRGLELVRRDTSKYAAQIARLQKEFDNLTFAACQNTIDRLQREQGITVRLLPGVVVIDSGVAEIMRRQHQGWAYLQV